MLSCSVFSAAQRDELQPARKLSKVDASLALMTYLARLLVSANYEFGIDRALVIEWHSNGFHVCQMGSGSRAEPLIVVNTIMIGPIGRVR